jgi:nicotinate (nicotinamide) nucleotide adenylyltransferase
MSSTTTIADVATTSLPPVTTTKKPAPVKVQTIGVFGGSFNPIHLGHALLAITTQQTCPVDAVVLVPVYQHAVKRDLLPFSDRVAMCRLAVAPFGSALSVSTVEQETGCSNGAMLRALKQQYPVNTKFVWICGDDFFRWMDRPAGLDTLKEVSGLIVQRRLHKEVDSEDILGDAKPRFFKEPVDEAKIRAMTVKMDLDIHFIYGELPHFSSSLVRRAPGHWRSFLTQTVVQYLDARPHLQKQLILNLNADAEAEDIIVRKKSKIQKTTAGTSATSTATAKYTSQEEQQWQERKSVATASVMQSIQVVHALQIERGRTGLYLSMGPSDATATGQWTTAKQETDKLVQEILQAGTAVTGKTSTGSTGTASTGTVASTNTDNLQSGDSDDVFDEVLALDAELHRIPVWLAGDRHILQKRCLALCHKPGVPGWLARLSLVQKFDTRIDVLMQATVRALTEILDFSHSRSVGSGSSGGGGDGSNGGGGGGVNGGSIAREVVDRDLPELLFKWCEGKEALGRLRAFVCAGGPNVPTLVHGSLKMRERLNQTIETKERSIARVLSLEAGMSSRLSAPDALHRMLEDVSLWEWSLMGGFASSTPLALVHKLLDRKETRSVDKSLEFDVVKFFDSSSAAIDFLLTFAKPLAASACARA